MTTPNHSKPALCAIMLLFGGLSALQDAARLTRIEVEGLKRYSTDQVIQASGLSVGKTWDAKDYSSAAKRLLESGFFKRVSYRYAIDNNGAVLTFDVEEVRWDVPVVFDNLIWFTEEELRSAVAREVPTFDGTAPQSGAVTSMILNALNRLVRERGVAANVEYLSSSDQYGRDPEHIFSVAGFNLPVCSLKFEGASPEMQAQLIRIAKPVLVDAYSKAALTDFLKKGVLPAYRQRGYFRAQTTSPVAKPGGPDCSKAVEVTVGVKEGPVYLFDHAQWNGVEAVPAETLTPLLKLNPGDVADGSRLEAGVAAARELYSKKGYITARIAAEPLLDDAATRLTFVVSIAEGPRYRMGNLQINGLPEKETGALTKSWKLAQGEIYDGTYIQEFVQKGLVSLAGKFKPTRFTARNDVATLIVDVSITFEAVRR